MAKQAKGTPDYFDAAPVSDGIAVRMSPNVSLILSQLVGELIRFLDNDELELRNRGTDRWAFTPAVLLRNMFPDAFRDKAAARAFRERHAAALRDSAAARHVHTRCANGTEYVISHAEVDDWLTTLGMARSLVLPRTARDPGVTGAWITYMQERIAVAVNPQLARYVTNRAQVPQQDHRWDLLEKARPRLLAQLAGHHVTRIRYHAAFGTSDGISVWLCTDTDQQRHRLDTTEPLREDVREILAGVGFTPAELTGLHTFVQSQETVDREYEGSWFLALR
jgi:hypothetical protein